MIVRKTLIPIAAAVVVAALGYGAWYFYQVFLSLHNMM